MNDKQTDVGSHVVKAILEDPKIGQAVIEIDDQDGIITLRGITGTEQDRKIMEDIASRQEGVEIVINEIISD